MCLVPEGLQCTAGRAAEAGVVPPMQHSRTGSSGHIWGHFTPSMSCLQHLRSSIAWTSGLPARFLRLNLLPSHSDRHAFRPGLPPASAAMSPVKAFTRVLQQLMQQAPVEAARARLTSCHHAELYYCEAPAFPAAANRHTPKLCLQGPRSVSRCFSVGRPQACSAGPRVSHCCRHGVL